MTRRVGIVSGYFALGAHKQHIALFKAARDMVDSLVVIVNNNVQTHHKYGFVPLPVEERVDIIRQMRNVDYVLASIDEDSSVAKTIEYVWEWYDGAAHYSFINGGDRTEGNNNSLEEQVCKKLGIEIVYLGDKKIGSSSDVIRQIQQASPKDYLSSLKINTDLKGPGHPEHVCDPLGCVHQY